MHGTPGVVLLFVGVVEVVEVVEVVKVVAVAGGSEHIDSFGRSPRVGCV
jgi:hypothetical protein